MELSLTNLPDIPVLKEIFEKLALLNVIVCSRPLSRYHVYTKNWRDGVDLAKIDNGSGDDLFVFFSKECCFIKGFDHESLVSPFAQHDYQIWPGMYDGVPDHFNTFLEEPSVKNDAVTFCTWKDYDDTVWQSGPVAFENGEDDGAGYLLGFIFLNAEDFKRWADNYYGMQLSRDAITQIYNGVRLSDTLIMAVNPSCHLQTVKNELKNLGLLS